MEVTSSQLLLAACILLVMLIAVFLFHGDGSRRRHCGHKSRMTSPAAMTDAQFNVVTSDLYTALAGIYSTTSAMVNDNVVYQKPGVSSANFLNGAIVRNARYLISIMWIKYPYSDPDMNSAMNSALSYMPDELTAMISSIQNKSPDITPGSYPQVYKYLPDLMKFTNMLRSSYNSFKSPESQAAIANLASYTASRVLTPEEQQTMYNMFTPIVETTSIMDKLHTAGVKVMDGAMNNAYDMVADYLYLNNELVNKYHGTNGETKHNIFQLQWKLLNMIQWITSILEGLDPKLPEYQQLLSTRAEFAKYAKILFNMPIIYLSVPSFPLSNAETA